METDKNRTPWYHVKTDKNSLRDALQTIIKLLDGSQPKDMPGAIMVAQSAIKASTTTNQ